MKETAKPVGQMGTMPQEHWHPGKGAKRITLSNSTAGKCTPMQIIKQPEPERTSRTEEQKRSSFQTNYDLELVTARVLQRGVSQ